MTKIVATANNIVTLDNAVDLVAWCRSQGTITIVASGGFDPLHPGHVGYLEDARRRGGKTAALFVLVNGDSFLQRKKGRVFQPLADRCAIVAALRSVEVVIPFESDQQTVTPALEKLRPHVFAKGGDRADAASIPEWSACHQLGIEIWADVGPAKQWSSSEIGQPRA
jgi:D-beta-D-heptose 7-phosphate kinase/D-beta-D-heptose 1-phosphate adenosyltransferase